jgi:CheY-like chemotaxis protein
LVVDDHATNRRIVHQMLTNWGLRPTEAADGPAALALLEEAAAAGQPFPLVLLDGHMPGMDGFALAAEIQKRSSLVGTAVLMLTSAGSPGDIERCRELGIEAYLMKPLKQSELLDAIVTALGGSLQPAESPPRAPSARRPLRILLGEDNPVNQQLAVRLLQNEGHRVTLACTGREVLAALGLPPQGHEPANGNAPRVVPSPGACPPFDLVLMDVQMPELDGLQATGLIRAHEAVAGGHLPIVAITAHAMKGDRERCLAAGMDGYVSKPIRPQHLFDCIDRLMDAAAGKGQSPPAAAPGPSAEGEVAADPGAGGQDAVDWQAALDAVQGDRALLAEVIDTFLDMHEGLLAQVRNALSGGDAAALRAGAHQLKGSLGYFGAARAYDAAYRLESLGRAADLAAAGTALADVERELAAVVPALRAFQPLPRASAAPAGAQTS